MLPHMFEKARALTLKLLDASAGDLSLHEIAKRLNNELGTPIQPGELANIRLEWSVRQRQTAQAQRVQEERREKMTAPKCSNCGGAHFVSQCTEPFPEKPLQLTELAEDPKVIVEKLEAPATPTQPQKEKPMDTPTAQPTQPTQFHRPPADKPPPGRVHENHLGRQKIKGVWIRRAYLNELLDENPGADPQLLIARVRERFGIGVDLVYVYETCRIARQIARLPEIPTQDRPTKSDPNGRQPLPTFEAEDDETPSLDSEIRELAQHAREVMRAHGLVGFALNLDEHSARWNYDLRRSGSGEAVL